MAAQTRIDARNVAGKPVAEGKKGESAEVVADRKDLTEDQAAAAAVVDAEQSEAVAAQVAAVSAILPTEAPVQSIGEVAQAPAPTTPDTTTTTTPPPMVEESSGVSPWVIGGAALLGVGAIAAVANNDDDDDNPPAAPPPGPPGAPPPGPPGTPPPGNVAPNAPVPKTVTTEADGNTALTADTFGPFSDTNQGDALTTVRIGTIAQTLITETAGGALQIDETNNHGYELVTVAAGITWDQALAAATAKGGHLAVLDTPGEMTFINSAYDGLGTADGMQPTWVGASQAAGAAEPGGGWSWIGVNGGAPIPLPGTPPGDGVWNDAFGGLPLDNGGPPESDAQYGAVYDGTAPDDTDLLFDFGTAGSTATKYLIEYENIAAPLQLPNGAAVTAGQVLTLGEVATLTWNSVFNTGGSVTYAVGDNAGAYSTPDSTVTFAAPAAAVDAGATQSIAMMIEDQSVLA